MAGTLLFLYMECNGRISLFDENRSLANAMAMNSEIIIDRVLKRGIRGFIDDLKIAFSGCLLDKTKIKAVIENNKQWRLVS